MRKIVSVLVISMLICSITGCTEAPRSFIPGQTQQEDVENAKEEELQGDVHQEDEQSGKSTGVTADGETKSGEANNETKPETADGETKSGEANDETKPETADGETKSGEANDETKPETADGETKPEAGDKIADGKSQSGESSSEQGKTNEVIDEEDEDTANPPSGNVYDYGDGMSAGDYLETNYSSYQNGGVFDLGEKQGRIGIGFDEGIDFFFEATQNIQSFSADFYEEPGDMCQNALVLDANFDGYNDLLLPVVLGSANICYYLFVYEDWSGYFVFLEDFQEVSSPEFRQSDMGVTSYERISAGEYEESVYYWQDIYSYYRGKVRHVVYDTKKEKFIVTQTNLSSDGRVGYEDTKEYTRDELNSLPSL